MKEFKEYEGPFIHTKETYKKIMFSYIITFVPFFVYNFYMNGIIKWQANKNISDLLYPLIFTFLPLLLVLIFETIYKMIFIKNQTFKNYLKENFSIFSILFFPFLLKINTPLYIIILSVILGYLLYKILFKKWYSLTILSYLIYLILGLLNPNYLEILKILPINYNYLVTSNGGFMNLLLNGSNLMCPIITILAFVYLYIKKDNKYQITISALITILFITTIIGLSNKSIWFPLYFILTGGTLFITTILASDFYSPATKGGKIMYGALIGLLIILIRFISNYNIAPFSIFIANTFTFALDYINEFLNKKIIYLTYTLLVILEIVLITVFI